MKTEYENELRIACQVHAVSEMVLLLIMSIKLWNGVTMKLSVLETVLYILSMLCVGFIEEVIFRGFLFKALYKENVKLEIVISSAVICVVSVSYVRWILMQTYSVALEQNQSGKQPKPEMSEKGCAWRTAGGLQA